MRILFSSLDAYCSFVKSLCVLENFATLCCAVLLFAFSFKSYAQDSGNYYSLFTGAAYSSADDLCQAEFSSHISTIESTVYVSYGSSRYRMGISLYGSIIDTLGSISCAYNYSHYKLASTGDVYPNTSFTGYFSIGKRVDCGKTEGITREFRGVNASVIWSGSSGFVAALEGVGTTACYGYCSYDYQSSSSCYLLAGSDSSGFCNYTAVGNGTFCGASDTESAATGDPLVKPDTSEPNPGDGDSGDGDVGGDSGGDSGGSSGGGGDGGSGGSSGGSDSDAGGDNSGGGSDSDNSGGSSGGDSDSGGDSGGGSGSSGDGIPGPTGSLQRPEGGSLDGAIDEWDEKLEGAKEEIKEKIDDNVNAIRGLLDLNLSGGGGVLPCVKLPFFGSSLDLCLDVYAEVLSYLRYVLLFMAAVFAAFVVLKD
ncbi:hypothetical protein [Stutzerimonas kirkiae]|uniref:hypothetical protein n=1 Tax=Stutzerimonas kirkiae TaxID=2211392 RepID=UPI0010385C98|nr:hypothetical protein [Stutzerimonas kirkiae]